MIKNVKLTHAIRMERIVGVLRDAIQIDKVMELAKLSVSILFVNMTQLMEGEVTVSVM